MMKKEILLSGLLGGIVIFAWLIISTGPLPVNGDIQESIPNDLEIHTLLKERIKEPGIYFVPGHAEENEEDLYPDYGNEPIFSIIYGGRTPDTFVGQFVYELFCIFAAPMIAAWLLSLASEKVLSKYSRRVLFVLILGLFLAVYGDLRSEKPMDRILLSSINNLITWFLAGLVIAWRIKPLGKKMV
jgi:hypothetical protein